MLVVTPQRPRRPVRSRSRSRSRPLRWLLTASPAIRAQVIKGWDEGVAQMSVGERAKLTISPGEPLAITGDTAMRGRPGRAPPRAPQAVPASPPPPPSMHLHLLVGLSPYSCALRHPPSRWPQTTATAPAALAVSAAWWLVAVAYPASLAPESPCQLRSHAVCVCVCLCGHAMRALFLTVHAYANSARLSPATATIHTAGVIPPNGELPCVLVQGRRRGDKSQACRLLWHALLGVAWAHCGKHAHNKQARAFGRVTH